MNKQTWGLTIPGYSTPSIAQSKLFAKRYPGELAMHKLDLYQQEREDRLKALGSRKKIKVNNEQD